MPLAPLSPMRRRPPRLPHFAYLGRHAYFLTACTHHRQPVFCDDEFAAYASDQLLRTAEASGFAVCAYCLMPDHIHTLVEGRTALADVRRWWAGWRQRCGFAWRRRHSTPLWQEGYWDWVLREDEDPLRVAAYIVQNPVRLGLVESVAAYRWVGSSEHTLEEIVAAIQLRPGPRRG